MRMSGKASAKLKTRSRKYSGREVVATKPAYRRQAICVLLSSDCFVPRNDDDSYS